MKHRKTLRRGMQCALGCMFMAALASCGGDDTFTVKGDIEGADNASVVIEKPDINGNWLPIDSTRTNAKGSFRLKVASPGSPEIYRLKYDNRYVYIPIDKNETLTLKSDSRGFGYSYTLEGTEQARQMAQFDIEANGLATVSADSVANFKRKVFTNMLRDARGNILSYYVLTKTVGGNYLFDPSDATDAKYYAAVATAYQEYNAEDPHAALLKQQALNAMRQHYTPDSENVLQAEELAIIDIDLPDSEGKNRRLSDIAGKGKPVVVIFSLLNDPDSPEFNREFNEIYRANQGRVEFYQVSFDDDQYEWRDAARNLPWINVFETKGTRSPLFGQYNISSLPTVYLYNSQGEIEARISSIDDLKQRLR